VVVSHRIVEIVRKTGGSTSVAGGPYQMLFSHEI
jgi:hypothetical protein